MRRYPKSTCLYLALTKDSAYNIMWPVLQEMNETYKLGATFTGTPNSGLVMNIPNGSRLRLLGADMPNFIKRIKGSKAPGIAVDEAQDFGPHIESLVDDVLTPMLVDYEDSWIAVTGTPGPVPQGYFFDLTNNGKYGYSVHRWSINDNIYIKNAEEFIQNLIKKKQWDPNHPTLLREWRNQWVLDTEALLINYNKERADYVELPQGKFTYIMGIDLGFKDADAIAVVAWSESSPTTYLVEEVITRKQGITELVEQINHLSNKYSVSKMVIDEGGLGKKIAEEIRRRHQIPVQPADKARKMENVAFLNDSMRLGTFKARADSKFVQDSYLVRIDWEKSTPNRIVVRKEPHSDIIDAVLYAFKESPAYAYEKPKEITKIGTAEYYKKITDEMEAEAEEYFKNQAELAKTDYY
jgi:phage terminase large subunit-like protein